MKKHIRIFTLIVLLITTKFMSGQTLSYSTKAYQQEICDSLRAVPKTVFTNDSLDFNSRILNRLFSTTVFSISDSISSVYLEFKNIEGVMFNVIFFIVVGPNNKDVFKLCENKDGQFLNSNYRTKFVSCIDNDRVIIITSETPYASEIARLFKSYKKQ